jgi:GLPGLI family protein
MTYTNKYLKDYLIIVIVSMLTLMCIMAQPKPFTQNIEKYKIIDTASHIVTYKLKFVKDTIKLTTEEDIIVLQIGRHCSKSYSKTMYDADSVATAWFKKGAQNAPGQKKNVPPMDVYKDYTTKKSMITYRSILKGPIYQYEEDISPMKWTLLSAKANILSYSCQKAITRFRGRTYEAWFTKDIPLPEGPWKFGGLPGLILLIKDTSEQYVYECVGIQQAKQNTPIKYWKWKYEPIERLQLQKIAKRMSLDTYNYLISIDQPVAGDPIKLKKSLVYSYNPIEQE